MALTARKIYEGVLYELQKVEAPSFYVDDFNYFASKAIGMYANLRYNLYEQTQQLSDDLAPLVRQVSYQASGITALKAALPLDYLHLLSGQITLKAIKKTRFSRVGEQVTKPLKRMRADFRPYAEDNYYNKPSLRSPYFRIESGSIKVLYGDESLAQLVSLQVEYLKKPQPFLLTQSQIEAEEDSSQISEWSEYSDREIIALITTLFLENIESQARLQTQAATSKSIL